MRQKAAVAYFKAAYQNFLGRTGEEQKSQDMQHPDLESSTEIYKQVQMAYINIFLAHFRFITVRNKVMLYCHCFLFIIIISCCCGGGGSSSSSQWSLFGIGDNHLITLKEK
jgi:hypothetical protein